MSKPLHPRARRSNRGFTLVEILMVVAIIGILASLAVPSYQRYVYRAEATELVLKFDRIRSALAELQATTGLKLLGRTDTIRVWTAAASSSAGGSSRENRVLWCPIQGASCGAATTISEVPGISASELASPRYGITLNVTSPFYSPVPTSYQIIINFPGDDANAAQVAHALADIMKPHVVRTQVSSRSITLSFLL